MKAHTLFVLGIVFFLSVTTLHAEHNPCSECAMELADSVNITKVGFGYGKNKSKAEELAYFAARDSLLAELRDSVAMICVAVEIKQDKSREYLNIKFFSKDEEPTRYYFHEDGILTSIKVLCKESICEGKKKYKACCVLSAPKEDFSHASNVVMFRILQMMSSFF